MHVIIQSNTNLFLFFLFFFFTIFIQCSNVIPSFFLLYGWKTSTMYTFTISVLKLYTIYYVIICMKLLCDVDTVTCTCTPSLISSVIEKQRHCLHCFYHAKYRQLHTYFLLSLGFTSTKIIQLLLKFIISAIVHSLWL